MQIANRWVIVDPGQRFVYGPNTDVIGRLIEVLTGQPLDVAIGQRVTELLRVLIPGVGPIAVVLLPANRAIFGCRFYVMHASVKWATFEGEVGQPIIFESSK